MKQELIEGDQRTVADLTQRALEEGHSAETILNDALISGMDKVGELFGQGEYFVPELLLAARAMQSAMEVLRPILAASDYQPAGKVIMGTVQGDLHDIGKKLVGMMLEGGGFVFAPIHNIQDDVPGEKTLALYRTALEHGRYPI